MNKEKEQEFLTKLKANSVVKTLSDLFGTSKYTFTLVGGAVIDILEGRTPKDYDFCRLSDTVIDVLLENGFVFQYETKTAITYKRGDIEIQSLKIPVQEFDFTISQATYEILTDKLYVDEISFNQKTLIPVNFNGGGQAFAAMSRIPHWRKKGYEIPVATYLSLLNTIKYGGSYTKHS